LHKIDKKKYIIVVGFRWSGSSAASDLIAENFSLSELFGDEFIPFSFGVLPILYPTESSFLKRFLSIYFLDPKFKYVRVSFIKRIFINAIVQVLSYRSHWLGDYKDNIEKYFNNGYVNNINYGKLITSIVSEKEKNLKKIIVKILDLTKKTNNEGSTILLNNIIPGNYRLALKELDASKNILIVCIKRNISDQISEIKKYSLFGRFIPKFLIKRNLYSTYKKYSTSDDFCFINFEELVLDISTQEKFLDDVNAFSGVVAIKETYTRDCFVNSHHNIENWQNE
jgi:hypothetical protein